LARPPHSSTKQPVEGMAMPKTAPGGQSCRRAESPLRFWPLEPRARSALPPRHRCRPMRNRQSRCGLAHFESRRSARRSHCRSCPSAR
jgi:hypothetical protein